MRTEKKRFAVSRAGLISAAGWVGVLATLAGFLGSLAWWLDLFSHFRPQLAAGLLLLALLAGLLRLRWQAGAFLLAALLNAVQLAPLYGDPASATVAPEAGTELLVMTINVDHTNTEYEAVIDRILAHDPDVLLVMEATRDWHFVIQEVASRLPNSLEAPRDACLGILMYSRFALETPRLIPFGEGGKTILSADMDIGGRRVRLVGVHPLPPIGGALSAERDALLVRAAEEVRGAEDLTLMFGDFNLTRFSSRAAELARRTGLVNSEDGFGYAPTWPAGALGWLLGVAIDHVWISGAIQVVERWTEPVEGSDHRALLVRLRIPSRDVP